MLVVVLMAEGSRIVVLWLVVFVVVLMAEGSRIVILWLVVFVVVLEEGSFDNVGNG